MNIDEFYKETNVLCELYGKKLNDTQLDFWYTALKKLAIDEYKHIIGSYAKKNKNMPTISDLIKESHIGNPHANKEDIKTKQVECKKCFGSGLIKYMRNNYEYLCTCNCQNGRHKKELYPFFEEFNQVFPNVTNEITLPKEPFEVEALNYDISQIKF